MGFERPSLGARPVDVTGRFERSSVETLWHMARADSGFGPIVTGHLARQAAA
jgi:hypothetical protein